VKRSEKRVQSLCFQIQLVLLHGGTVSFDRNGGFSSASSHGGGSYRVVQLLNNAMGGVTAPTPLDLSRFGEGGGVRVTFRGDDALAAGEQGAPRAVNLNVYETRSRMNFGGFSPSSTSSSFVVYPSSEQQTWFLPFSTFMGSTFTSPDEDRGLPLASLSTKLGMQVSFQEGLFSVALENIEAATNAVGLSTSSRIQLNVPVFNPVSTFSFRWVNL
jgi:hypothetical protein